MFIATLRVLGSDGASALQNELTLVEDHVILRHPCDPCG